MLVRRGTGRRVPTFTSRAPGTRTRPRADAVPSAGARTASLFAPRTVRVARVVRETRDAVTLVLEDPTTAPLHFEAGQFFTLLVPIGDEVLRRAYSASSDARDTDRIAVTVKRVTGGIVSNYLNDETRAGDLLQVLGPSGSFTLGQGRERHLILLAGGSGITPMMSILRTVLGSTSDAADTTRISLLYGNRSEADVIFRDALDQLAETYAPRLTLRHVLSDPTPSWDGAVGILDEPGVRAALASLPEPGADALFFVCGPEPMMRAAREVLRARRVPDARIFEERFNMPHAPARSAVQEGPQVLTIRANGAGAREVYVAQDQTLLEAGLSAGVPLDYSCAMGGCGACKVRLCEGEVEMEEPNCLSAAERADGYVLACVSRLRSAATIATAKDPSFLPAAAE
jgi:ring-1,2-phenylacetyl-CoA epoxidase subunit PaaE